MVAARQYQPHAEPPATPWTSACSLQLQYHSLVDNIHGQLQPSGRVFAHTPTLLHQPLHDAVFTDDIDRAMSQAPPC